MATNKRAQAAMEFLMTYGWAILVVLVVIGALAYFGILNPSTLLPERCEIQMGLYCKDHLVQTDASDNGKILLTIENGRGSDIRIALINLSSDTLGTYCLWNGSLVGGDRLIRNGASESFVINASTGSGSCSIDSDYKGTNSKHKWDVIIKWYSVASGSQYTHTAGGQLMASVE
ncbi:hypothetical protein DRJ48_04100 [Candidatus Woesearchaeota archaeon]|nr:MAG: hypothetical protein DRJ48_04100 [Candidatus Woesearchaeota archaeon]